MSTVVTGLSFLEQTLQRFGFDIVQQQKLFDRQAIYFVFQHRDSKQQIDFVLTNEFVSDLPGTASHKVVLENYLGPLAFRVRNVAWNTFYCISGRSVTIEMQWPVEAMPQRAASFMWVDVKDASQPLIARCSAIMTHSLDFDFRANPFGRPRVIVNSIRHAVDRNELKFYGVDRHPKELQSVDVRAEPSGGPVGDTELKRFICGKVYWLGFRMSTGLRTNRTWVIDPWDSMYLGTDERNLAQAARVAQAEELIKIDDDGFAIPQDRLLRMSREYESTAPRRPQSVFVSGAVNTVRFVEELLREEFPELRLIQAEHSVKGSDIRSLIESADLVVADISNSANAAYEVGFAHALKKPVAILYDQNSGPAPFDVSSYFMLPYDPKNRDQLRLNLRNYVLSFLKI